MKIKGKVLGVFLYGISALVLFSASSVVADTGTYTISTQNVDLWVQTDGNVLIRYEISMLVHTGNIPWVTVGLPTSNYEVRSSGGDAAAGIGSARIHASSLR